jgi:predicted PurR-regulated permease PerM
MNRDLVLKLEKWAIWLSVLGVLFLLRSLFPALFLTFILSYMGNTAVHAMTGRFPFRRLNLVFFYAVLIAILSGIGTLVVPRILLEASGLAKQIITSEVADQAGESEPDGGDVQRGDRVGQSMIGRELADVMDRQLVKLVGQQTFDSFSKSEIYRSLVTQIELNIGQVGPAVTRGVREFFNGLFAVTFQFALSLILSFIVIWDLPRIRAGIASLSESRFADTYAEIAPGMRAFGMVLGRAFEAQTIVALVNTLLSTIAFLILGIPSVALLGTIVFFCSYIPVAGMIISTLPAAVLAFKVGGFSLVAWLVAAIAIIHAVEAYALNPLIYGRHMRLHPLLVLIVLLVAEHLFGVWGLLLSVPVTAFVIKFVIGNADPDEAGPAAETA